MYPPYLDKVFNFIISTILTRAAASFFGNDKNNITLCGSKVTLMYGKEEEEINSRKKYGIKLISNETNDSMDLNGVRILTNESSDPDSKITGTLIYAVVNSSSKNIFTIDNTNIDINDGKIDAFYRKPFRINMDDQTKDIIGVNNKPEIKIKTINISINGKTIRTI